MDIAEAASFVPHLTVRAECGSLRAPPLLGPHLRKLSVLQSLAYIIECHAKGCHGEAMDEFSRLCRRLECDKAYRLPNSNALLSRLRTATTEYQGTELRRKAVNDICGLNRKLRREVVGP